MIPGPNPSHVFQNALLVMSLDLCHGKVIFARWALNRKIIMSLFVDVFDEVFCKVGLKRAFTAKEYAKKMLLLCMKKELGQENSMVKLSVTPIAFVLQFFSMHVIPHPVTI